MSFDDLTHNANGEFTHAPESGLEETQASPRGRPQTGIRRSVAGWCDLPGSRCGAPVLPDQRDRSRRSRGPPRGGARTEERGRSRPREKILLLANELLFKKYACQNFFVPLNFNMVEIYNNAPKARAKFKVSQKVSAQIN